MHEEVVHGPVWFDSALTHEAGELGIVADTVQKRVEEDGLPIGTERSHGAGSEVHLFVPIGIRDKELLEDSRGLVLDGVDGFDGVERDRGIVRDGKAGETFGVAELRGDDVLEEFGDGLCSCDVTRLGEKFGVAGEELPPALGGLLVPGENFFSGEDGLGHTGS